MVAEKITDESGSFFMGWRCVPCGNISDPVIIANKIDPILKKKGITDGNKLLTKGNGYIKKKRMPEFAKG